MGHSDLPGRVGRAVPSVYEKEIYDPEDGEGRVEAGRKRHEDPVRHGDPHGASVFHHSHR